MWTSPRTSMEDGIQWKYVVVEVDEEEFRVQ